MKKFRIRIVLAGVVLLCGVSLMALVYLMLNKPVDEVTPGILVTRPSPVASPLHGYPPAMKSMPSAFRGKSSVSPSPVVVPHASTRTVASAPVKGLYLTSTATPHSVGGGGGAIAATSSSHGSSGRGISYSGVAATMPITSFTAMASSRQMAAPEEQRAPEMAHLAAPGHRAPPPPDIPDLPGEHQLVDQPVGSPAILFIMVILYSIIRKKSRKSSFFLRMCDFFCNFAPVLLTRAE